MNALRWRVAYWLDRRDGWCWANLVTWACWRSPRLRDCRVDSTCVADAKRNGECYCGRPLAALVPIRFDRIEALERENARLAREKRVVRRGVEGWPETSGEIEDERRGSLDWTDKPMCATCGDRGWVPFDPKGVSGSALNDGAAACTQMDCPACARTDKEKP